MFNTIIFCCLYNCFNFKVLIMDVVVKITNKLPQSTKQLIIQNKQRNAMFAIISVSDENRFACKQLFSSELSSQSCFPSHIICLFLQFQYVVWHASKLLDGIIVYSLGANKEFKSLKDFKICLKI